MNELEIAKYLSADKYISKFFRGVFARDELVENDRGEGLYIINTDISTGPGKHWVCLFLSDETEYFDSLGLAPVEVKAFLDNRLEPYVFSSQRLQGPNSDVCGDYCILYAYFRCRGWMLEDFIKLFTTNLDQNDRIVEL